MPRTQELKCLVMLELGVVRKLCSKSLKRLNILRTRSPHL